MRTRLEARLADLAQRDRIAREQLGARGEKLKAAIDRKVAEALEAFKDRDKLSSPELKGVFDWYVWDDFDTGSFENVENITLRWISGDSAKERLLEYAPDLSAPFAFITSEGRRIVPDRFLTDGGTVPDFATLVSGIDRYGYLPAYLIHDWEYVLHHCGSLPPDVTQEKADRALLEALKTMMTTGLITESRQDFWAIETALGNFAHLYWGADTPCSLGGTV